MFFFEPQEEAHEGTSSTKPFPESTKQASSSISPNQSISISPIPSTTRASTSVKSTSSPSPPSCSSPPAAPLYYAADPCQDALKELPCLWEVCQDSVPRDTFLGSTLQVREDERERAGACRHARHMLGVATTKADLAYNRIGSCHAGDIRSRAKYCRLRLARHHLATLQQLQRDCQADDQLTECWVEQFRVRLTQQASPGVMQALASSHCWEQVQQLYYPGVPLDLLLSAAACSRQRSS